MSPAVVVFVAVAYLLSIVLSLIVYFSGGQASPIAGLGIIAMFFPALAVLVVRVSMGEKASIGGGRFPLKYLPFVLLMPAVLHAVMLPLTALLEGGLPWQAWLTPQADGLIHTPASQGWGTLTTAAFISRIVANAAVGIVIVSFFAFFEEIGWRAWLLPRLAARMDAKRAVVASALLWAFWHTPFALSGIHVIDGVSLGATALIMPIGHIGAGLVIGWLWQRSESLLLVTIAHGALNNWGQYAFKYMTFVIADPALILGAGNVGLLVVGSFLVMYGLVAAQPTEKIELSRNPNI